MSKIRFDRISLGLLPSSEGGGELQFDVLIEIVVGGFIYMVMFQ